MTLDESIVLTELTAAAKVAQMRARTVAHGMDSRHSTAATSSASRHMDIAR